LKLCAFFRKTPNFFVIKYAKHIPFRLISEALISEISKYYYFNSKGLLTPQEIEK